MGDIHAKKNQTISFMGKLPPSTHGDTKEMLQNLNEITPSAVFIFRNIKSNISIFF